MFFVLKHYFEGFFFLSFLFSLLYQVRKALEEWRSRKTEQLHIEYHLNHLKGNGQESPKH